MNSLGRIGVLACIVIAATVPSVSGDTVIDTRPPNGQISPFGEPNTATYGQTVTVPAGDNALNSFTFTIDGAVVLGTIDFAGYVAAWDGTKATGPILYESSMRSLPAGSGFTDFTFNTGSLALTPGAQYVLFISASEFFDGVNGLGRLASRSDNPYTGGQFVFENNGSNFASLTSQPWDNFLASTLDASFVANFSSPAAVAPLPPAILGGLVLMGGTLFRKVSRERRHEKPTTT